LLWSHGLLINYSPSGLRASRKPTIMQNDPELHIRRCAFNIFHMIVKVVGRENLSAIFHDTNLLQEICRGWTETTRFVFGEIKSGRHQCSEPCPTEDLFKYTLPADKNQDARMVEIINQAGRRVSSIPTSLLAGGDDGIRQGVAAHLGIALQ